MSVKLMSTYPFTPCCQPELHNLVRIPVSMLPPTRPIEEEGEGGRSNNVLLFLPHRATGTCEQSCDRADDDLREDHHMTLIGQQIALRSTYNLSTNCVTINGATSNCGGTSRSTCALRTREGGLRAHMTAARLSRSVGIVGTTSKDKPIL